MIASDFTLHSHQEIMSTKTKHRNDGFKWYHKPKGPKEYRTFYKTNSSWESIEVSPSTSGIPKMIGL